MTFLKAYFFTVVEFPYSKKNRTSGCLYSQWGQGGDDTCKASNFYQILVEFLFLRVLSKFLVTFAIF
ncbi:hypothetical protein NF418_07245 [Streptococcus suis]|uniref:hypothetical protein n=1 Tax=Streptococcus suis TaxID=1307 RepID=UPI0021194B85|nr:hypothetical protein [Streptococcus suis]MDW8751052.1 hypothetical protein [Streptococcus suis]